MKRKPYKAPTIYTLDLSVIEDPKIREETARKVLDWLDRRLEAGRAAAGRGTERP